MAIPIFVWLISCISAMTRMIIRTGVRIVTTLVVAGPIVIGFEINGIVG